MADREDENAAPQEEPARPPLDEDAAWAALVAGFDREPEPGAVGPWPEVENVRSADDTAADAPADKGKGRNPDDGDTDEEDGPGAVDTALSAHRSIVIHPVIRGPRDFELADDDEDAHFVPPEPPPLPDADVTTKFAWIAVLGGPLLLIAFMMLQLEMRWWTIVLGIGGFLGGFTTLVARMRTGEEDDDERPGGGAVV